MIRLVIFDLDGVLTNSRDVHYEALNEALRTVDPRYVIPYEEHISTFDGLPTTRKLHILSEKKGLPVELHDTVWRLKQQKTKNAIEKIFTPDEDKIELFENLHSQFYSIVVCSNSVRSNVRHILYRLGLLHLVDYYYGNEDVRHPKPHSEIYTKAMMDVGVTPRETLIIEDSHIGRIAAQTSGAYLHAVRNPAEVSSNTILPVLDTFNQHTTIAPKWQGGKMNC